MSMGAFHIFWYLLWFISSCFKVIIVKTSYFLVRVIPRYFTILRLLWKIVFLISFDVCHLHVGRLLIFVLFIFASTYFAQSVCWLWGFPDENVHSHLFIQSYHLQIKNIDIFTSYLYFPDLVQLFCYSS